MATVEELVASSQLKVTGTQEARNSFARSTKPRSRLRSWAKPISSTLAARPLASAGSSRILIAPLHRPCYRWKSRRRRGFVFEAAGLAPAADAVLAGWRANPAAVAADVALIAALGARAHGLFAGPAALLAGGALSSQEVGSL